MFANLDKLSLRFIQSASLASEVDGCNSELTYYAVLTSVEADGPNELRFQDGPLGVAATWLFNGLRSAVILGNLTLRKILLTDAVTSLVRASCSTTEIRGAVEFNDCGLFDELRGRSICSGFRNVAAIATPHFNDSALRISDDLHLEYIVADMQLGRPELAFYFRESSSATYRRKLRFKKAITNGCVAIGTTTFLVGNRALDSHLSGPFASDLFAVRLAAHRSS